MKVNTKEIILKVLDSLFSLKKKKEMHYLVFLSLPLNEGYEQFLRYAIFDNIFQFSFSDTLTDVFVTLCPTEEKGHN